MYQRYAGLIFDMDGTLLDSEPVHCQAWREVLQTHGMRFDDSLMAALNGAPTWRFAEALIKLNGVEMNPHHLAQEKNQHFSTLSFTHVPLLPAAAIVKSWHGRRPMAVGTGSNSKVARALLECSGLSRYFEVVVTADDVQQHKPAPDTFLRCAELMGVPAAQCVVFEDAEFGLQAAQHAGMDVVDVRLW